MAGRQTRAQLNARKAAEREKKWRKISRRSKIDAAFQGFYGLHSGDKLCQDFSYSKQASELEIDLAARQVEHCLEAWNFLSQAAWGLVNAQFNQATHMAYYSEIRAADSLFASTGIAVKKNPSYYLNDVNKRVDIKGNGSGTHSLIRGMWPTWCKRLDAISVFERLKVTQTVSLKDIWNAMGVESLAESGLLVWGYELTNLSKDHSSRNTASYEVRQTYEGIFPAQSEGKHRLLSLVWEHLAPGGIDGQLRFEVLYAQYLIWGYAKQFANSEEFEDSQQEYDRKFVRIINNISENCGVSSGLLDALLRVDIAGDPLFEVFDLASQRDAGTENIFSRAFILTRLATCRLNDSIEISRCGAAQAWIQKWLFELGVMKVGETPEDVTDLADELIEKASSVSGERQSDLWPTCAADAAEASRLNIALCWGLSLQS